MFLRLTVRDSVSLSNIAQVVRDLKNQLHFNGGTEDSTHVLIQLNNLTRVQLNEIYGQLDKYVTLVTVGDGRELTRVKLANLVHNTPCSLTENLVIALVQRNQEKTDVLDRIIRVRNETAAAVTY